VPALAEHLSNQERVHQKQWLTGPGANWPAPAPERFPTGPR